MADNMHFLEHTLGENLPFNTCQNQLLSEVSGSFDSSQDHKFEPEFTDKKSESSYQSIKSTVLAIKRFHPTNDSLLR
jgi:hypothetical protein